MIDEKTRQAVIRNYSMGLRTRIQMTGDYGLSVAQVSQITRNVKITPAKHQDDHIVAERIRNALARGARSGSVKSALGIKSERFDDIVDRFGIEIEDDTFDSLCGQEADRERERARVDALMKTRGERFDDDPRAKRPERQWRNRPTDIHDGLRSSADF